MTRKGAPPRPKRNWPRKTETKRNSTKSIPPYKWSPVTTRKRPASNTPHGSRSPIHLSRQIQELGKIIRSPVPNTVNVIVRREDRVSKILPNLNYHDIEMAKILARLASFSGINEEQVKRGVRFVNTVRKLARVLFFKQGTKCDWAQGMETLKLLDEHARDLAELRAMIENQMAIDAGPDKKLVAPTPAPEPAPEPIRRSKKKKS